MKYLKQILIVLALISPASALTYTTNLNLVKPAKYDTNYTVPFANSMDTLDSYVWGLYTSTGSFVLKAGDTMTGPLTTSSMTVVDGMTVDTASNTLVVDSVNHRVGLLTANPATLLHISSGSITIDGNAASKVAWTFLNTAGNKAAELVREGGGSDLQGVFYLHNNGTAEIALRAAGNSYLARNSGNVGIGTTAPATKLHISSGTITMIGTGSPATGGALCLNAANAMSKCTSAVDASGNCTCP